MVIELNARRNFTRRFLAKKKKKKNLKRRQRNSHEGERGREIVFRYSRESDSPRASTCSTCPPSEDLSVLHILLLSHPFTRVRVHIYLDTANVPTHLSLLYRQRYSRYPPFFSLFFLLFEIHSFPFVFLSIQNYSIFIYILTMHLAPLLLFLLLLLLLLLLPSTEGTLPPWRYSRFFLTLLFLPPFNRIHRAPLFYLNVYSAVLRTVPSYTRGSSSSISSVFERYAPELVGKWGRW